MNRRTFLLGSAAALALPALPAAAAKGAIIGSPALNKSSGARSLQNGGATLMPKKYEAMRDKFKREGMSDKAAKGKAARIYNAERKSGQKPVTRKSK